MLVRDAIRLDSNDIFEWRNDIDSRSMSFESSIVKVETHQVWFANALKNEKIQMYIGEVEGGKIGICRFEIDAERNLVDVSININPSFRGKGLAKNFLKKSIAKFHLINNLDLIARVKTINIRSQKIFRAVGFFKSQAIDSGVIFSLPKRMLNFKKVSNNDSHTLYEMLKGRKHNISHNNLPSFSDHEEFVKNNLYLHWYLVLKEKPIGSFYIQSDNSIGINIENPNAAIVNEVLHFVKSNFTPRKPVLSLIPEYFYINVSKFNNEMQKILECLDLEPIQVSFKVL